MKSFKGFETKFNYIGVNIFDYPYFDPSLRSWR
jgi:hypothetical protein